MSVTTYCRICWNSEGWQYPTGEAAKLENHSYVTHQGFGHEEWLLYPGWTINGYRYGFIQAFNKYPPENIQFHEVILHTISPTGSRYFVGRISKCELLTRKDASEVHKKYIREGWLKEMGEGLSRININPSGITEEKDSLLITNIRYKFENLEILDPIVPIPKEHKIQSYFRYKARYFPNDNTWKQIGSNQTRITQEEQFQNQRLKSTTSRTRAAQKGITFDPNHDRLQNMLYEHLQNVYGEENVFYEAGKVDLIVKHDGEYDFYEIKIAPTVKKCIRVALGQPLEYAHWPTATKALTLIVVGKIPPKLEEKLYLEFLREKYNVPLYYQFFDETEKKLSKLI